MVVITNHMSFTFVIFIKFLQIQLLWYFDLYETLTYKSTHQSQNEELHLNGIFEGEIARFC